MPLSRLENFLINTDGNILYVNPSDLDATDSFDNKGNSLTRPFKTIQRALIEAARFAYQIGDNNDRFDKTTILLYPGTHLIDNRPGYFIKNNGGSQQYLDQNEAVVGSPNIELTSNSIFDLDNAANVLYKFNSVEGGVIVPKGTSIVGLDLRKTKVKPLYVPDPEDDSIPRSALFRVTGGCYFWQFSMFDADRDVFYNKDFGQKRNPAYSHHKLTCFEYADGLNEKSLTDLTDLQMYYFKLMNGYGANTGNRQITDFPTSSDFQPNSPEFKIVGDLSANDFNVTELTSSGTVASVTTGVKHGLNVDDSFRVIGVGSDTYNGSYRVTGITSERKFTYTMLADANDDLITIGGNEKIVIEADNVTGASPYIFNLSLRSVFGMCGMHADGSKATGFKSMVVAQFTGIGLQKDPNAFVIYNETSGQYNTNDTAPNTVTKPLYINQDATYKKSYENFHVKASNDAVIQAVSVFAIGFAQHFLAEDGADQSITNSNSNFGARSLIATGFRKDSFDRDNTGYITHIIPPKDRQENEVNVLWKTIDVGVTTSVGISSHLYLLGEKDLGNPPSNISDGYRVGANFEERLYLDAVLSGVSTTFDASIVMQVPSGVGPVGKKEFVVKRTNNINDITVATDTIQLTENHNFLNGESITINSDNGQLPDGIKHETTYYAITNTAQGKSGLGADKIQLASSFNNAVASSPSAVTIKNTNGGIITIISRVSDKIPGEIGHPIQFDSNVGVNTGGWYILADSSNQIFTGISANPNEIESNNSSTYIRRTPENRDLNDRIYKLRYVVPKEFSNAKAPTKNFVLQESSKVSEEFDEEEAINNLTANRNPHVIAGITTTGMTVTVTTEKEHRLQLNDRVRITNVKSSNNTTAANDEGFNGYYTVTGVTGTRTFTYTIDRNAGTFSNDLKTRGVTLPTFSKNEYDTTYIIREVETIQEYEDKIQDGIYYLTCLIGNISPSLASNDPSGFAVKKFKQDYNYIYPTVDRDNPNNDPPQSISAASNKLIGKVNVNDEQNSISKEGIIEFLRDNRVGFAITGASWSSGTATFELETNHNLDRVRSLTVSSVGSGYAETRNVSLVDELNSVAEDVTANIEVNGSGEITSAQIVNPGSGVGAGITLRVSGGDGNGVVTVGTRLSKDNYAFQVVGVGTDGDRLTSGYNGVWEVTGNPSPKQIQLSIPGNPGIHTTAVTGIIYPVDKESTVSSIVGLAATSLAGIVTVTTSARNGFAVGNKIKIANVAGVGATIHNGDHVITRIVTDSSFEIRVGYGITWDSGVSQANARVFKYGIGAFGEDTSLQNEKISGSMIEFCNLYREELSATGITTISEDLDFSGTPTAQIAPGDFLQIEDEIVRVKSITDNDTVVILRGVLGTIATNHPANSIVRGIKVIPSEVRRFSSIRASGHTFEYVGYGPGNYSTALPQRIGRTLTSEEELLSIFQEQKGGVTFFSGMNDRGEFFTVDGKNRPTERFISEVGNDFTGIFDDLYVRNTLRVGGGPNKNLPSEFQGPVNFTNKITNTDTQDGINAIKLQIQGNSIIKPFFIVGPTGNPSLVVNQNTQFVGIKTASPAHELDVNGTIRADVYENFKLSDLPNNTTEETTFAKNRVLKVNEAGTGYELVDVHTLANYALTSYGISGDGTVHTGVGSTVSNKLQISGVSTSSFAVGDKVKMFGVNLSSDTDLVDGIPAIPQITKVGTATTVRRYRYWVAQYHLRNGKVGVGTQINPKAGIGHTVIDNFNDQEHVVITLNRTDTNHGILLYRQESADGDAADINQAQLVQILGSKDLGSATAGIEYKDYGVYDQCLWSPKGNKNQFTEDQIHFPNISTEGQRRGWALDEIVSIGNSSITVNNAYDFNDAVGFGTTNAVKVVHDNTYGFTTAMNDIIARGGAYLDLPSGTYLTQKLIIPNAFTIKGHGKNTILKQQFFANDTTDGGGNNLAFDGNFVGIGTTNGKDVTISDITIDGNSGNNITFESTDDNYLVYFKGVTSSLFKNMEIRNSPADGMIIEDSSRVSIENSSFVDGSLTDRYSFQPIQAQDSDVLRINDSLFENFPGAVDLSASSVVSTGGNIIRNCGTGLRTYATGKITTTNNILLGPADEFLPSPDIYDSDYNSINITIDRAADFEGPVLQYIENGDPKDISSTKVTIVSAGIGTIIDEGKNTETLGTKFLNFDVNTVDKAADLIDRENGYIQLSMPLAKTSTLGIGSALGYNIVAQEYEEVPTGFTTYIGISTGAWFKNDAPFIGVGATEYRITLAEPNDFVGVSTGDIIKLVDHSVNPSLAAKVFTVSRKSSVSPIEKQLILTGYATTANDGPTNGAPADGATVNGYISIRKQFVIAKGRVGVI